MYTTYTKMFTELGFKNPNKPKHIVEPCSEKGDLGDIVFTIFNIGKHFDENINLYAIRDEDGNEYLFSRKGLKFL